MKEPTMHRSHNRRERQGDNCAGALVRCGSTRVHGGKHGSGLARGGLGFGAARRAARQQIVFLDDPASQPLNRAAVISLASPFGAREMPCGLPLSYRLAADLEPCSQGAQADNIDGAGDWVRVHAASLTDC